MPDFGNIDAIGQWAGAHGPLALGAAALLCALGVPVPTPILLLAFAALSQGAFSRMGPGVVACFLGALVGESLHYALGAATGPWLRDHVHGKWRQAWTDAERLFQRYSEVAVARSRSVLGAIGLPIDWIAGSSGFDYRRFALSAVVGDGVWIVASAAVGYWLGANWQLYPQVLPVAIAVVVVAVVLVYLASRLLLRRLDKGEQPGEPKGTPGLREPNEAASRDTLTDEKAGRQTGP